MFVGNPTRLKGFMSMIAQFQKLDDLIGENTRPPVTAILRNQLALMREQVEAYHASSEKQDETLAKQIQNTEALASEYKAFKSKHLENHKVGVTLKNGEVKLYPGNTYAILPNKTAPVMVEFRKKSEDGSTFVEVGHVNWTDVATLHPPELISP